MARQKLILYVLAAVSLRLAALFRMWQPLFTFSETAPEVMSIRFATLDNQSGFSDVGHLDVQCANLGLP